MPNNKYPWIVLKYDVNPNQLICERCGKLQVLPEGSMSFDMLEAMVNCFLKLHKRCKDAKR